MDSSSKFFFSFSVNYAMIVKLVNLIVLLGSKLLNRFRKIFNILIYFSGFYYRLVRRVFVIVLYDI